MNRFQIVEKVQEGKKLVISSNYTLETNETWQQVAASFWRNGTADMYEIVIL